MLKDKCDILIFIGNPKKNFIFVLFIERVCNHYLTKGNSMIA